MTEIDNNDTALATHNLTVGYNTNKKELKVLENINLTLKRGELVCFMGPNGVGKSTLLRTLAGVQAPLYGSVTIEQQDISTLSTEDLAKRLSLVLTDRINAGNMTGKELIALGRYPHLGWRINLQKEDLAVVENAIDLTGVAHFADKKIHELSDGQLQKVMIARALCQDTPIMILDEPTAHLDLNNRVSVINLLKDLSRKTGKSILIATHELDLALQSADRLWLAGYNSPVISGFPEDMVLNDSIDRVFELKGFDLKTGHLKKLSLGKKVALQGSGYQYLWTKNALERNGYEIVEDGLFTIKIVNDDSLSWEIEKEGIVATNTLEELVNHLNQQSF